MSEKLSEYCRRQASRPCPEDYGFNVEWNLAADDALALEAERDELKAKLESVLGLFGDYDFAPTVEQAIEIWNLMRNREIALAAKLEKRENGLVHIRRWASAYNVQVNPQVVFDAVVRMCNDVLAAQEEKE